MIIDAYAHAMPERYRAALAARGIHDYDFVPPYLCDIEGRRIFMAPLGDVRSVATPMLLPVGRGLPDGDLAELARIYNNEMAELADQYPDLIVATVAALPLGNFDDTMREAERAVTELGMKGIQLPCNFHGVEPGSPEMRPLLRLMAEHDLPIWLHPWSEASDRPQAHDSGGWEPLTDMADAMIHFVCSGAFEELPDLKVIVHHGGAYIPFFHHRVRAQYFAGIGRTGDPYDPSIPEADHTIPFAQCDNLRNFYADTAFYGHCTMQIANCISFYGADHVLFGTDFPLPTDRELVPALDALNDLYLKDETRAKIEHGNIEKLLHL